MPSKLNLDSNETLKQGAKGQKVQQLQEILKALNLDPGIIDGDFGNNTVKAVKQFQSQKGLEADGVVGKKTQDALIVEYLNNEEIKSDWQQIDNLINGIWENDEVISLAHHIIPNKIISINKISQGRNSAVFKLGLDNDTYLKFKIYPVDDNHDRINSEFYSTKILSDFGFDSIPKPLKYDKELGIAAYQWLEGDIINEHNLDDISKCSNFINDLFKVKSEKDFSKIGLASAACISGKGIEEQLHQRINFFANIENKDLSIFLIKYMYKAFKLYLLNFFVLLKMVLLNLICLGLV